MRIGQAQILSILRFLFAHIVSSVIAALSIILIVAIEERDLFNPVGYFFKFWLAATVVTAVTVLPLSIVFYGLPEWKKYKMPLWVYIALGTAFALLISTILIVSDRPPEAILSKEALLFYLLLGFSGAIGGFIFGLMRRPKL